MNIIVSGVAKRVAALLALLAGCFRVTLTHPASVTFSLFF